MKGVVLLTPSSTIQTLPVRSQAYIRPSAAKVRPTTSFQPLPTVDSRKPEGRDAASRVSAQSWNSRNSRTGQSNRDKVRFAQAVQGSVPTRRDAAEVCLTTEDKNGFMGYWPRRTAMKPCFVPKARCGAAFGQEPFSGFVVSC